MSHKFKLGQRVRQARAPGKEEPGTVSEVVRLMPEDRSGEVSYRIRSPAGERAVTESELVPAG